MGAGMAQPNSFTMPPPVEFAQPMAEPMAPMRRAPLGQPLQKVTSNPVFGDWLSYELDLVPQCHQCKVELEALGLCPLVRLWRLGMEVGNQRVKSRLLIGYQSRQRSSLGKTWSRDSAQSLSRLYGADNLCFGI